MYLSTMEAEWYDIPNGLFTKLDTGETVVSYDEQIYGNDHLLNAIILKNEKKLYHTRINKFIRRF